MHPDINLRDSVLKSYISQHIIKDFRLAVFEQKFVESVLGTRLDWISLGAESGLIEASGCVHKLINCKKRSDVAIIIPDRVVIEGNCR